MKWFEDQDKQEMPAESQIHCDLYLAVGRFSNMIGLSQWQFNKERRTIKFKLCSLATVFSLLRLVFFSFPFILLPAILFVIFKDEELQSIWNSENLSIIPSKTLWGWYTHWTTSANISITSYQSSSPIMWQDRTKNCSRWLRLRMIKESGKDSQEWAR